MRTKKILQPKYIFYGGFSLLIALSTFLACIGIPLYGGVTLSDSQVMWGCFVFGFGLTFVSFGLFIYFEKTMKHLRSHYTCPVCGYDRLDLPPLAEWGSVCACCGYDYGHDDWQELSPKQWREQWIREGCKWFWEGEDEKPSINWDAKKQLETNPFKENL